MNNKFLIIPFLIIGLVSCNPEETKENIDNNEHLKDVSSLQIDNIKAILNQFDYKTSLSKVGDTIKIDLFVDSEDYHSPYFVKLVKELMVVAISKEIKVDDKIVITEVLSNGVRNKTPDLINFKTVQELAAFNSRYKTTFDFKKYIYKNIRKDKLMKFNAIIADLLIDRPNAPLKEKDFILAIMNYADDCMGLRKDDFYTKLLKAIKEVASDKTLWPDFNPQDIDYFLEYCNKSTSKKV